MNCVLCKFSKTAITPQGNELRCRRYPPSLILIPTLQGAALASDFPVTLPQNVCGEFVSKPTIEQA